MSKTRTKKLFKFVIPAIIGQVCFFLFTIVDGIFVGRGVGDTALGAINIVMPFVMVVNAVYLLVTIGGVAIASVRIGREDKDGANQSFMHSFVLMIIFAVVLTVIGTALAKPLGYLFGANESYIGYVIDYMIYYSIFIIPSALNILFQFFCRNDGSPMLVMIAMVLSAVVNVFLDWLFVFPLQMGIRGAAIATGISQTLSFVILLFHFILRKGDFNFRKFKIEKKVIGKIFLRGFPEAIARFATPVLTICMNHVLLSFVGEIGVNSYSVISYVASFSVAIFMGVSEGVQPLFGQSYGEKNDSDLKFYYRASILIGLVGSVIVYVVILFASRGISHLFISDTATIDYTVKVIPMYAWGFLLMSMNTTISSYLYSTKRTKYAVTLNLLRSFGFTTLCVLAIPHIFGGGNIIWFTFGICETLSFILAFTLMKVSERHGIIYK